MHLLILEWLRQRRFRQQEASRPDREDIPMQVLATIPVDRTPDAPLIETENINEVEPTEAAKALAQF